MPVIGVWVQVPLPLFYTYLQQKGKIIGIKPKDKEENKKIERKIYDIAFIDFMEDKLYKEEKNEDEMSRFVDKYKVIKSYQI